VIELQGLPMTAKKPAKAKQSVPPAKGDQVDIFRAAWAKELPDLDTEAIEINARARRITLALRPGIEAIFAAHGLDAGEFDVIGTLLRSGAPYRLRPTELFRSLMVSSGGLTDRLVRLEKSGLIRRLAAPGDGRSLLVELTQRGQRVAEETFRADMEYETGVVSALTAPERQQLAGLLRKLALAIET